MRRFAPFLFAIVLLLPSQAAAAAEQFSTSNGVRTEAQIDQELADAGYPGPWDTCSAFEAYHRATGHLVTFIVGGSTVCDMGQRVYQVAPSTQPVLPAAAKRTIVVLIGGLGSSWDDADWVGLRNRLEANNGFSENDFFVFSYDGWSVAPNSNTMVLNSYSSAETCQPLESSEKQLASMVRYLRDNQWASSVILVGHSLGGVIAFDVAAQNQDLTQNGRPFIRRLVTVDSPLGGIGFWRAAGAPIVFAGGVDCDAATQLNIRKDSGAQIQSWLSNAASNMQARGVDVWIVSNPNDGWVNLDEQQVNANVNLSLPAVVDGTHSNHSAIFYDPASLGRLAGVVAS